MLVGEHQRRSRNRNKLKLCKCRSFCTTYNPATGDYEGEGNWISQTQVYVHAHADAYKQARERRNKQPQALPSFAPINYRAGRIKNIADEVDWLGSLPISSAKKPLVFLQIPNAQGEGSTAELQLDPRAQANASCLFVRSRLDFLLSVLQGMPDSIERDVMAGRIHDEIADLEEVKLQQWLDFLGTVDLVDRGDPNNVITAPVVCTDRHFRDQLSSHEPVARAAILLALVLQNIYFVKRRAVRVHLSGIRSVLRANNTRPEIVNSIPLDPRTCLSSVDLDPVATEYIVCPDCHCLYPYDGSITPLSTPVCTFRSTPASIPCGANLWTDRRLEGNLYKPVPLRRYLHHDLRSWVGRLLSRPGIEDLLNSEMPSDGSSASAPIDGIMNSPLIRDLKDAAGRPYLPGPPDECRLVFGLSIDGFLTLDGPQNASSNGIWLVLLNLPESVRKLPQNICLIGIIPGPNKPSKEEMNHYLDLLVKDLLPFWDPGVFYTQTAKYRLGRLVLALITLLVMDHPGLRQVIGYAGAPSAHYMCIDCGLDIDDIHITERQEWPANHVDHIRRFATLWRDAASEDDRDQIFDACGWRWSSLWYLPYYDPIRSSVVDSMHTLDLNVFQHHIRHLFWIDLDHIGGDRKSALSVKPQPAKSEDIIKKENTCRAILAENAPTLLYNLLGCHRQALHGICVEYGVVGPEKSVIAGTKWVLSCNLHQWRLTCTHPDMVAHGPDDEEPADITELLELSGSKRSQGERVLIKLLSSGTPSKKQKAFPGCWSALYKEICLRLGISVPEKTTNKFLQDAIILSMRDDSVKRDFLLSCLPLSKRSFVVEQPSEDSESESQSDTGQEVSDAEETGNAARPRQPTTGKGAKKGYQRNRNLVIRHLTDGGSPEEIVESRRKAFNYATIPIYLELCGALGILVQEDSKQKQDLHNAIVHLIDSDEEKLELLRSLAPPKAKPDAILGADVMAYIWQNMKQMQLPSWMSAPPANWGTAKRGTLSANNWQVICTVVLPVLLIWLWRELDAGDRRRELLRNFMDLVTASRLACLRRSSPAQISQYNDRIKRYVQGIQTLYPSHRLKPTHHTAMHIGDSIQKAGPVKDSNTAFYERYIKFLRHIPVNGKFGKMETTMMRQATRYANLCALLEDNEQVRRDMSEMVDAMDSIKSEDLRGFDLATILDPSRKEFSIPPNAVPVKLQDNTATGIRSVQQRMRLQPASLDVYELDRVSHMGARYTVFESRCFRDSSIIFKVHDQPNSKARTGVIHNIFAQLCTGEDAEARIHIFVLVGEHRPVTADGIHDPYLEFGFAAGYLCRSQSSGWHIVHLSQVVSHVVLTNLPDTDFVHILPMDKLMTDIE